MEESLVLVTGAGASRDLARDQKQMPLMHEWSGFLCGVLNELEDGLAAACGLQPGMSGPDFEEQLGKVLKWDEMISLGFEFVRFGHSKFQRSGEGYHGGLDRNRERLDKVREAVNRTLYDLFDQRHIDESKAATAYGRLLAELGSPGQLVVATTNYDRSAESALRRLDFRVATGFDLAAEAVPPLDPSALSDCDASTVPVIHLHGAVGWYRREGTVYDHRGGQPYNPSLGTPVVLYPDPDKDPTDDPAVSGLWAQFEDAVNDSKAICVIGHSLHDDGLVKVLNAATEAGKSVAIGCHQKDDQRHAKERVPGAVPVHLTFGPDQPIPKSLRGALAAD